MKNKTDDLLLLQTHNPVPETPGSGWANSDAGSALFSQVEANVGEVRLVPQRPWWRRRTVTIPVFVVLSASALLFASAIAGDKVITVSAEEALANPAAVERRLADEGIDATIEIVPAKDALVGKWFHLYLDPKAEIDDETFALLESYVGEIDYRYEKVAERCGPTAGECERTSILEIPGSVKGPITLVVGRAAGAGEEYWAENIEWSNELAPSGALYCMQLEAMPSPEIQRVLRSAGYQVEWTYDPTETGRDGEESRRVVEPPSGTQLTVAYIFRPGIVSLRVSPVQDADRHRRIAGTPTSESGRPDFGTC